MKSGMCWLVVVAAVSFLGATSSGQVNFTFNYLDSDTGFSDPNLGTARRAAMETAADNIEDLFSAYTANIVIDVQGDLVDDGVLASATSHYNGSYPGLGFVDVGDVALKILNGDQADPAPNASDGLVSFNFEDHQWELGDDFQFREFDFISTAMHELVHTVGFLSTIAEDGTDHWGSERGEPGTWGRYDQFIGDANGPLIDDSYSLRLVRWATASTGGQDGLFFYGPNAMQANGGDPVALYSPLSYEPGSSVSHVDISVPGDHLMKYSAPPGRGPRTVSDVERGMLQDLGFTALVPEPSSIFGMLMLMGGVLAFRRQMRVESR